MSPFPVAKERRRRAPLLATLAGFLLVWSCNPAANGEIKPSDVYQVVESVNAELAALLGASNIEAHLGPPGPPLTPRQPRHVVQKAREVLLKVQTLRTLNGMPESPVPLFPLEEAVPADSKRMVDAVYRDITELRSKFNVTEPAPPAPLVPGKSPTDVYERLQRASDILDLLGVPRTMPNDVCRVAAMVVEELETIVAARGRPLPPAPPPSGTNMAADDSYQKAFEVLEHLKAKVEADPALMIRGGIVPPARRPPPLTPAHVLDIENNLLAELGSIKAQLGIATPTVVPPLIHGKTPADTVDLLNRALALVGAL